jgi:tetratricopeptide (TPR) repeat protein
MHGLLEAVTAKSAGTAVMIEAVDGMAGVGKSTFAIHAAHQLRDHFPDAQLYTQLHAHDASRRPLDPASGLETLLRILGVPAERIPRSLEDRAALWRSQLARRRALIVLDDVASHEQVWPLLPGAPGCLVMITSRTRLTQLAGIHSISLDVLSGRDSAALFTSIVGADRATDADAVAEITHLCGYLPLAIHLVARRLSHRPAWSVADLAQRLMQAGDRIGEIHIGNPEIGRSFELSYQGLTADQQQMFRQLCLHPGPDFAVHAAAAAAGISLAESERRLNTLLDHHLLEEPVRARFRFHDLIRAYARDLAVRDDDGSQRQLTLHRMLDYYLHTADQADRILYPHRDRIDAPVAHPPANPSPFAGEQDAREWLDAELTNLLTTAQYAAEHGLPAHAAFLPHVLAQFLQTHGHWEQVITAHVRAIPAWRAVRDSRGAARALTDLAFMLTRTGRYSEALQHAHEALAIFRTHGDQRGEADVLDRIGLVYWQSSRFRDALVRHENALAIWRTLGERRGEAEALAHSAMSLWHVGSYDEAMSRFTRALSIYRDVADCQGEAKTLNNIADVQLHLGLYDDALRRYEQAQALAVAVDDRQGEAVVFNNMGNVYQRLGRYSEALVNYRKALTIYRDLGDRRCEADTLNSIGMAFRHTHHYSEAIVHHQKALAVAHELAEPYQEARSLCSIGDLHLQSRHYDRALDDYRAAPELSRRMGDPYQEGLALSGLASAQYHLEHTALAFDRWREALALFEKIGVPEADEVRSRLLAAGSTSP